MNEWFSMIFVSVPKGRWFRTLYLQTPKINPIHNRWMTGTFAGSPYIFSFPVKNIYSFLVPDPLILYFLADDGISSPLWNGSHPVLGDGPTSPQMIRICLGWGIIPKISQKLCFVYLTISIYFFLIHLMVQFGSHYIYNIYTANLYAFPKRLL